MKCLYCNNEFSAQNKRAKFCSPKCRVYSSRGFKPTVTDDVTLVTVNVTQAVTETSKVEEEPIDAKLQMFLDQYEKVYFRKRPKHLPIDIWTKMKERRLEELKFIIDGYEQQRKAGKEI